MMSAVVAVIVSTVIVSPASPVVSTVTADVSGADRPGVRSADTAITVKETAGVGATDHPVQVVIPVAEGERQNLDGLRVEDAAGGGVPAQFSVLNRYWGRDNSIRHILATFQADVGPYTGPGTGTAQYRLTTGSNPAPSSPVSVSSTSAAVTMTTGSTAVTIARNPVTVTTPDGQLVPVFRDADNVVRPTFDRSDVTIEVEEAGPVRARVKLSAPTLTLGDGSIRHGWAMRLTLGAGASVLEVETQLRNAALDSVLSGPLYFQSFELQLDTTGSAATVSRRAEPTATASVPPIGAVTSGTAGVGTPRFAQTWPNGVANRAGGLLVAELFPSWSENQVLAEQSFDLYNDPLAANGTGLYWLEDMQAVIKTTVIDFAATDQAAINRSLALAEHPPVAVLPLDRYRSARATLDLGGAMAADLQRPTDPDTSRTVDYPYRTVSSWISPAGGTFFTGWDEFLHDPQRKRDPRTAGGWPSYHGDFIVTGNPADYFIALDRARGELNVANQWLPGYDYDQDQATLGLTENPYAGPSWRRFDGHNNPQLRFPYRSGTFQDGKPRDDQHGWFYHVEIAYWLTADPWIKDWYEFVAEFRQVRLAQGDPFPDYSARAVGHALSHAMQAYRVTGDPDLLADFADFVDDHVATQLHPVTGAYVPQPDQNLWPQAQSDSWQSGYLLRAIISYLEELPGGAVQSRDPVAFDVIETVVGWNVAIGNFSFRIPSAQTTPASSDGAGLTMVDPQIWYANVAGDAAAADHVLDYLDGGIGGGGPYGDFDGWGGTFEGRLELADPAAVTCGGLPVTVDLAAGESPTNGPDVIVGTGAGEIITGLGGDDVICAGGGADQVTGGDGDDVIYGEGGGDTLAGNAGNDVIYGGPGADIAFGGSGADELWGGDDGDRVGGGGDVDTVRGEAGADRVNGGSGDDLLVSGGDGADNVTGGGGNDGEVRGGPGADLVGGNGGRDVLYGDGGADVIFGGPGNDIGWGGPGNDLVNGGKGVDELNGEDGDDELNGGKNAPDVCNTGPEDTPGGDQAGPTCEIVT
jgi:hypothetical protein